MKYSLRSVILIKKITPHFYVLQYKIRNINGFKLKFNLSSYRTQNISPFLLKLNCAGTQE